MIENRYYVYSTPFQIFLKRVKIKNKPFRENWDMIITCCFRIAKMSTTRINASMKNPTMATTR